MLIRLLALFLTLMLALPLAAQDRSAPDHAAKGGAQTLDDIMARQSGQVVDDEFRRSATGDPDSAAAMAAQLGALGGVSDAERWRALRHDSADITVLAGGPVAETLVQSSGMQWFAFREGPLATYGAWTLIGTLAALVLFYLLRGRIAVDGGLISVTGLSLVFPFEIPLFGWAFAALNAVGLPEIMGFGPLPATLAHIYIGSVGMEGASGAMTHGEVDEPWAHQHHSIWLDEVKAKQNAATPAE